MKRQFISSSSPAPRRSSRVGRLIRKTDVLARVPFSDTTLWRAVRAGRFPAPVKIGSHAVAWRERDVIRWINSRRATR
jgi:prophage regulatory protein